MVEPKIGMGVTIIVGSDRYPATIVEIRTPKLIVIQEDESKYDDSIDGYVYKANPYNEKKFVSKRKNGIWRIRFTETPVFIGERRFYQDPCF